ncbi:MAG TPA: molybdopterin-dependent oxidoreductase [Longimicrobiaceae bacterium]|nr:molybdopterin-dependent oxidoreductase [Longimicrobiaceae bacterium]
MSMDRRRFLAAGGLSLASAVLAACDSRGPAAAAPVLKWAMRRNEAVERVLLRHTSMDLPATTKLAGRALPSYYIAPQPPVWNQAANGPWMLEVSGLVKRPLRIPLTELARLRSVTQRVNHYCVEGWTATTEWTGVRMSEIARLAGVLPDAGFVDFQSFDEGYHESWDLESAMHPQTLVVYGREGKMLRAAYGAPARVHSPIKLGYKNTKYLTKIVFMPEPNGGYWTDQRYEWFGGL